MEQPVRTVKKSRSSIFNLPIDIVAALVFCVPAVFAWIPVVGYFAWIIPMYAFLAERKSNFVRFCASESMCISTIRLVFAVVFDGIRNVAVRTVALYGANPEFAAWWGDISSPGLGARIIGIICAGVFTVICAVGAYMAYKKRLLRLPVVSDIADYMTKELKPISKHSNHTPESAGSSRK